MLVGAEVDVDEILVVGCEIGVSTVEVAVTDKLEVAIQLHALLTRLATSPVQAATAYVGIALVAVTAAVVNVAQKD